MAATTISSYLTSTFPTLPSAVNDYVTAILSENIDDLRSVNEIIDAVGDHIQCHVSEMSDQMLLQVCTQLMLLLHRGNILLPKCDSFDQQRKLDNSLEISPAQREEDKIDGIGKISIRETVDAKKLEKTQSRKAERGREKASKLAIFELGEASVSQAANRRDAKLEVSGQANSMDIKIENIDVAYGTKQLLNGAQLSLSFGRRYGMVGRNGIGKSTFLKTISSRQLTIAGNIRMLSVEQEVDGDDTCVIDCVLNSDEDRRRLLNRERELHELLASQSITDDEKVKMNDELTKIYGEIQAMQLDKGPALAAVILFGLGFNSEQQKRPTREFSGGWRMRLALAQALFIRPDLLLLDEPTNMLDMKAVYWLENHLQTWAGSILLVSHDRTFLNSVCTDIIHFHSKQLDYYRGNYDDFEKTRGEKHLQQQREYLAQQQFRAHAQEFIDKFRYNAKRASMVQSRLKMIEKLPVLQPVEQDTVVRFRFPDCELLAPPVVQLDEVSFRYATQGANVIFDRICVGSDAQSRICIVGDNGAGKTTLLKLLMGDLEPTTGHRSANRRLKIGYFAQHHVDQLDMDMSGLQLAALRYPGLNQEEYRAALGRFGLSGDLALQSVRTLSGGQKSRLAFALLGLLNPNYLVMDEPTNHLDVETVEALGEALELFKGGVVLVSHDERLIARLCKELWVVKDGKVYNLEGGIEQYKKEIVYITQ